MDPNDSRAIGIRDVADSDPAQKALARRNLRFGWALLLLFCLIFAGTFLVAVLYLQLD